jgi:hypothetical protein
MRKFLSFNSGDRLLLIADVGSPRFFDRESLFFDLFDRLIKIVSVWSQLYYLQLEFL